MPFPKFSKRKREKNGKCQFFFSKFISISVIYGGNSLREDFFAPIMDFCHHNGSPPPPNFDLLIRACSWISPQFSSNPWFSSRKHCLSLPTFVCMMAKACSSPAAWQPPSSTWLSLLLTSSLYSSLSLQAILSLSRVGWIRSSSRRTAELLLSRISLGSEPLFHLK